MRFLIALRQFFCNYCFVKHVFHGLDADILDATGARRAVPSCNDFECSFCKKKRYFESDPENWFFVSSS